MWSVIQLVVSSGPKSAEVDLPRLLRSWDSRQALVSFLPHSAANDFTCQLFPGTIHRETAFQVRHLTCSLERALLGALETCFVLRCLPRQSLFP